MTSHVERQIAARIAAARQKRAQRRRQRAELDEARELGLEARHTVKMRRWAEEDDDPNLPGIPGDDEKGYAQTVTPGGDE